MRKYVLTAVLVIVVLLLCSCGKKKKYEQLKYESGDFNFVVNVPLNQNYEFRNGFDDANDKKGPLLSKFNLVGDKIRIEFVEYECNFLNYESFKRKYGADVKKSWDNYKKYLFDKDFFNATENQTKTITVNGVEGVEYRLKYKSDKVNLIIRTLNTDSVISDYYYNMYIFAKNDNESIEELVKQEDVKLILDSMKFIKK